jgi:tight adherence protein B
MSFNFALPGGDLTFFGIVLIAIFTAIFAIAHLVVAQPRQRVVARAMAARQRLLPTRSASPNIAARDRRNRERHTSGVDALINRLTPNADKWRNKLARSGTPLSLGSVVLLGVVLAIVFGAGFTVAGLDMIYAWPLGVVLSVLGLRFYIRRLIKRRSAAFLKLLPDAIGLMVRGLRSGLPVTETILAASREIRDPLGEELRRIGDQVQLGRPLEEVMAQSAERNDLAEMAFMAVAFSIQRETGGNLAEMLENLDTILRRRRHMQLKVRAYTGEARASAMIIGALPFVLLGLLSVVNFEYISSLFTTSLGHIFLGAAGGCIALGIGTLVKLARFSI